MVCFKNILKDNGFLLQEEYHLCCYDPAMWLEKEAILNVLKMINGDRKLLEYWPQKPAGNGPWSWPIKLLSPRQVEILKNRYWKVKNVEIYQVVKDFNLSSLFNEKNFFANFLKEERKLFVYYPSDDEFQISYYIEELKNVAEFFEVIEECFGKYVLFDVEENNIFTPSTEGPFGSYTLAYNNLGKMGCRNYACTFKCPVFPLDEHLKNLTYKIELLADGLTSEVTDIIIYDINGTILCKLNEEGEFETV